MPKVSIIIPVYNKEMYLENTLNAITNQKYQDYELILIDDGSIDKSKEIIEYFEKKNKKIKTIHQKNSGVSAARNKGLEIAIGEWVWFIDADDTPNCSFLEDVKNLLDCSKYDVIFANYTKIMPNGEIVYVDSGISGNIDSDKFATYFMEEQYETGFYGYLWCKLIKRNFIEENKIRFDVGLTLAEDLKFMVGIYASNPNMYFWTGNSMRYTVDAAESSKNKRIDYKRQFDIQKDIYDWVYNMSVEEQHLEKQRKRLGKYVAYVFYYAYEEKRTIQEEIKWFCEYKEIKCLIQKNYEGNIMSLITILAYHKCFGGIKVVLWIKNFMRRIARWFQK